MWVGRVAGAEWNTLKIGEAASVEAADGDATSTTAAAAESSTSSPPFSSSSNFFVVAHVVFFSMHIYAYSHDGIGLSMMMFV